MDSVNEALARKLSELWFEMYRASALHRPELLVELQRIIAGPDASVPEPMVRAYMLAIIRGALVTRPLTERARQSRLFGRLFG